FEPRELLLRIASILRRVPREEDAVPPELRLGPFVYDVPRGELRRDGHPVHLTSAEGALMAILAGAPGKSFTREELGAKLGNGAHPRGVNGHVTRLRKKIRDGARMPRYVQTVRGIGYCLRPD